MGFRSDDHRVCARSSALNSSKVLRRGAACLLSAGQNVDVCKSIWTATGTEPWLDLVGVDIAHCAGRFIELVYSASLLDEPVRPVLRFFASDGSFVDYIGAAPVAGSAVWIGRVPPHATHLAISPTNRLGSFAFKVERLRARHWPGLLLEGIRRRPRHTWSAILTRCIGWWPESDNNLAWATSATDFEDYPKWLVQRLRPMEPSSTDRPRFDWSTAARFCIVVKGTGDAVALARTFASLQAQAFHRWDVLIVGAPDDVAQSDVRVASVDLDSAIGILGAGASDIFFCIIEAGDVLPAHALAFLAEQRRRYPAVRLFYGDEIADGHPVLKPGWTPRLLAARFYLGRAVFVAGLDTWTLEERRNFLVDGRLGSSLADGPGELIKPLRRVLLETARPFLPRTSAPCSSERAIPSPMSTRAAIVILTEDQPALIARAVASVRAKSPAGSYRMFIVDNGHHDGPAATFLSELEHDPDIVLLRRSGNFTFSGYCNEAVAASDEGLLVFLNDDTEVLSDDWLQYLAADAYEDGVGAVGAKLTFPDGRLQHVGVLVGMGGSAGHFGALAPGDDPGWLGRNSAVHEVSAVTGACLAVARDKFLAIGGFDAEHLPVELSDIDLCLKLNARGWQTIVDPRVHLLHEESATRGRATFRRLKVYSRQRDIFVDRWRHVLRDDPTFHPGLSLYSSKAALG